MSVQTENFFEPPDILTWDREEEITEEVIADFIELHLLELERYLYLMKMYKGWSPILDLPRKDLYKPDVRTVVPTPRYMTDTFTGYFNGIPVKKSHPDDGIQDKIEGFESLNDMENQEYELAKMCCIYGRAYELMYQDEDAQTRVAYNSPEDMFVVYDNTVQQLPLLAVRYGIDEENHWYGEIYHQDRIVEFTSEGDSKGSRKIKFTDEKQHGFNDVPVYEYYLNEERIGLYETTLSLINAYNKALSEKGNDVEYFSDSYLLMLGLPLEEEGLQNIRENRIIHAEGDGTENAIVKFLDKPDTDQLTENYLNRLEVLILKNAMIADMSDENFGSASGTALAYKLLSMSNLALSFQRKFESSLRTRYRLFCAVETNSDNGTFQDEWQRVEFNFSRNQPRNTKEEAETAVIMSSVTSMETALSELSAIQNVPEEMARIEAERRKGIDEEAFNMTDTRVNEEV